MEHAGASRSMVVDRSSEELPLEVAGTEVARYVWRPELPAYAAPRPFLHPVRTLGGRAVTAARPHTHRHQLGISIAAPDIGGRNFWGGRTFVAGHGPAWLDDHGQQRHEQWLRRTADELAHTLRWIGPHQETLLRERRSITCRKLDETSWTLGVRTRLTSAAADPLPVRSPAALGRPGAGYGGFFWRGPAVSGPVRVRSPAGDRVGDVHGRTADWLAVEGPLEDRMRWAIVFVPGDEETARDRWFVRARDYLGVGSSLAWDRALVLEPGESVERHVLAVVVDGVLGRDAAAQIAEAARSAS